MPNKCQPCVNWFPKLSYEELLELKPPKKDLEISWVTSNNSDLYGHKLRLSFIKYLKDKGFPFNLYGRGFTPIIDKKDGILPYKYSIAIENFQIKEYWTEKIADCFLCWTIPFYWGAPNIDKYFPDGSYILIDPKRPKWSLDKISDIISSNYYAENLEFIREARELVLNKYQLFPYMSKQIDYAKIKSKNKREYYIPKVLHPREVGGIAKLRYKFDYFLSKHFNR